MPTCPKCKHDNSAEADQCAACGAHLYVDCRRCGHRNLRALSKCSECGRRLHRSLWRRLRSRVYIKGKRIGALEVVLFLIALLIVYHYVSQLGWGGLPVSGE